MTYSSEDKGCTNSHVLCDPKILEQVGYVGAYILSDIDSNGYYLATAIADLTLYCQHLKVGCSHA